MKRRDRPRSRLLSGATLLVGLVLFVSHPGMALVGGPLGLTIPRFLAEMLGEQLATYPSTNGYVFSSTQGAMLRHRNFYDRHFKPAVAAAGLPDVLRFHDLRHTCAALLIANGRHMEEVKEYLGHSTIRVTSDRYGHLFPKARQALAEGLDATFQQARNAAARGTGVVHALPGGTRNTA